MESFKLVTQDVPRAFDARSIDTFADGLKTEIEEEDQHTDSRSSFN